MGILLEVPAAKRRRELKRRSELWRIQIFGGTQVTPISQRSGEVVPDLFPNRPLAWQNYHATAINLD